MSVVDVDRLGRKARGCLHANQATPPCLRQLGLAPLQYMGLRPDRSLFSRQHAAGEPRRLQSRTVRSCNVELLPSFDGLRTLQA